MKASQFVLGEPHALSVVVSDSVLLRASDCGPDFAFCQPGRCGDLLVRRSTLATYAKHLDDKFQMRQFLFASH